MSRRNKIDASRGRQFLAAVAIFGAVVVLLQLTGVYCPIRFATGVCCPGCGLTRAWISLLTAHPLEAVAYHPLFWTVPLAVWCAWKDPALSRRSTKVLVGVLTVALVALWVVRLMTPDDATLFVHSAVQGDVVFVDWPMWLKPWLV